MHHLPNLTNDLFKFYKKTPELQPWSPLSPRTGPVTTVTSQETSEEWKCKFSGEQKCQFIFVITKLFLVLFSRNCSGSDTPDGWGRVTVTGQTARQPR